MEEREPLAREWCGAGYKCLSAEGLIQNSLEEMVGLAK